MIGREELKQRLIEAVHANGSAQTEWLRTLARFPSLRGNEAECQAWLAGEFARRGWSVDSYTLAEVDMADVPGYSPAVDVDYSKAVQVVATLPVREGDGGRSLILQGHIDVVPPGPREQWAHEPFEPQVRDGMMTGRGVYDMKAGVAEMVFALDALRAIGFQPAAPVFVETVSEEECTGNGALSTLVRGYTADACLIPEAVDGQLLRAQLGSVWFRMRLTGRAAHVLETEAGESAILRAYDYIAALQQLAAANSETAKGSEWFGQLPNIIKFSVGKIKGGDWIGMVPSWCELDCRLGVLPGQDLADVRESILGALREKARSLNAAPPEVDWIGFQAEAYVLEPGSAAEAVLEAAHRDVTGAPLGSFIQPATSDVRHYGLYYGIPALCYGGKGSGLHGSSERVDLASMLETTVVIAMFIAEWCGLAPIEGAAAPG
jgi:acetylornithine deacetylase